MRLASNKTLRLFAIVFFAVCWAYALVTRFTGFFMAPRIEKIILLDSALLAAGIFSILIFNRLLPKIISDIQNTKVLNTVLLSMLVTAALLVFIIQPLNFPENHSLEIIPLSPSDKGSLTLVSIHRINLPGGKKEPVPPGNLDLQGGWQNTLENDSLTWAGDPQAKITYARFMQSGIEITFETGPDQGQARILWDGKERILDLSASKQSKKTIALIPALDWHRADLVWQFLVALAWIAEFFGLSVVISIILLILTKTTFRNFKPIIIFSFVLLVLIPLINAFDPVIEFQDSNLSAVLREAIDQPNGDLRLHKLLTIVKIEASGREIVNLEGIQHLRKLESLKLRENNITIIDQLRYLTRLRELDLRDNSVSDISPLEKLINLESLNLRNNPVTDLSPLKKLVQLIDLNLTDISLKYDIAILLYHPNLTRLNIRNCDVTDLTVLAELFSRGALQDNPASRRRAQLDIRDNPISRDLVDGYAPLRPFWENISERAPFVLPKFNTIAKPTFSHTGGFYSDDFWLTLSSQDDQAVIYYTLDGSEPTRNSPIYSQPVRIQNRANQPNQVSAISTTSDQWKEPLGEVFKATVVRAKVFNHDGAQSATVTHTYFVEPDMSERYTLTLISINTDPDYLFGIDQGIYVTGRKFYEQDGKFIANYHQTGSEWERPVSIEYFDPSGVRLLAQNGGIRIQGASIRKYPQKSFRLYADDSYDESDYFEYDFFPDSRDAIQYQSITRYKTLILRNSGNNAEYPGFRDTIMNTLFSHTTLDPLSFHPALVFLNSEYWGIYNLRENLDEFFISSRYLLDPREIVILERDAQVNTGQPGDEAHYQALLDYIRTHDITSAEHYDFIAAQMDIDNFIDYQIAEIYSANNNWPSDNIKYWRYKSDAYQPNAPYGQDGRWRWLLFDLDTGFGYGKYGFQDNTLLRATGEFLIRNLFENTAFRTKFINRFADHLNTSLTPRRVLGVIDHAQSVLDPEIPEHIARWNIMENSTDIWDQNVDIMRTFAYGRPDYVRQHILDYFKLPGTAIVALLTDNTKGTIRINSIDITPATPGVVNADEWSGIYFEGIPITISAIPKPGFQFAGWEGIDLSSPDISLTLTENITLRANFMPVEE